MKEYQIAHNKVIPYLSQKMKWPSNLISPYGRVPVQIGVTTVWADIVFYINRHDQLIPWMLVEVKKVGIPLEQAIPQAESYSLILNAPYFCITDGEQYQFYKTGIAQGRCINIVDFPTLPNNKYLTSKLDDLITSNKFDKLLDSFIDGLKHEKKFYEDTLKHHNDSKYLNRNVFMNLNNLTPQKLKKAISNHMMMKPPNKKKLFKHIDTDYSRIHSLIKFIKNMKGDPIVNINKMLDPKETLHLEGCGLFFITQLLAGAYPKKYMVLEENISKSLQYLGFIDILVKSDTSNGYIYINDLCLRIYERKIKDKLGEFNFGLAAVHNFFWHYYVYFKEKGAWFP